MYSCEDDDILKLVDDNIIIPASKDIFVISENSGKSYRQIVAEAPIYFGEDFRNRFSLQKVLPRGEQRLASYLLTEPSFFSRILAKAAQAGCETDLAVLFHLMNLQPDGCKGVLLTNNEANTFFVKDDDGGPWRINVYWEVCLWFILMYKIGDHFGWRSGSRVFLRVADCQ